MKISESVRNAQMDAYSASQILKKREYSAIMIQKYARRLIVYQKIKTGVDLCIERSNPEKISRYYEKQFEMFNKKKVDLKEMKEEAFFSEPEPEIPEEENMYTRGRDRNAVMYKGFLYKMGIIS